MENEQQYQLGQLFDDQQQISKIDMIQTKFMRQISQDLRKTKRYSIQLKKQQEQNFQQALNLDMTLQKYLEALEKIKISLLQFDSPQIIQQNETTRQFRQTFQKQIKLYNKTLLLRQAQIGSLIYLIENRNQIDFKQEYEEKYGDLKDYAIRGQNLEKPINLFVMQQAIQTQINFLQEYKDMTDLLRLNTVHKKYLKDLDSLIKVANKLKIINSKIITIADIFPYACTLDKSDLFSYKKTHDRWRQLIRKYVKHKFYGDSATVRKSFEKLRNGLNLVNATMSLLNQSRKHWQDKKWNKLFNVYGKMMKCAFYQKDAKHQAEVLISNPDGKIAKEIWNLPEDKMVRSLVSSTLPAIQFSKQYWIPRVFRQYLQYCLIVKETPILPKLEIEHIETYHTELLKQQQYSKKIPIRINCPFQLKRKGIKPNQTYGSMFRSLFKKASKSTQAVIFHIHGGGFISMSSFIHQTYTRNWANNLEVPIISVDYGKAPQHPFPEGLYDCFEAYMWTLYEFRQVFDVEPLKVILVGDSAGGNLVAALTTLLIQYKLRIPDGIVLVYPALNLNYKNYTPSLLTALNDLILPHTFLKICLDAYIKTGLDPKTNSLLSPIVTKQETLKNYPKTRIFVGSRDPFHDDCCRLTQKLNQLSPQKCYLTVFEEFPHGFLQFDIKTQPHQACRQATKEVQLALKQLLQSQ